MSNDETAVLAVVINIAIIVWYIISVVCTYIALAHSVRKRIVSGEDFGAGGIFFWILGWSLAWGLSIGFAPTVYYLIRRPEILITKFHCTKTFGSIRMMRTAQVSSPQMHDQHQGYRLVYQATIQQPPQEPY